MRAGLEWGARGGFWGQRAWCLGWCAGSRWAVPWDAALVTVVASTATKLGSGASSTPHTQEHRQALLALPMRLEPFALVLYLVATAGVAIEPAALLDAPHLGVVPVVAFGVVALAPDGGGAGTGLGRATRLGGALGLARPVGGHGGYPRPRCFATCFRRQAKHSPSGLIAARRDFFPHQRHLGPLPWIVTALPSSPSTPDAPSASPQRPAPRT